ncbi:response regulator transcription factor [Tenacibaculum sp. 190524A02b]|uniref:response regulator transcription factor n=1 Tax=Tenacibaculum vairaonense TaxID=3137860 RepID=UPI0031FB40CC
MISKHIPKGVQEYLTQKTENSPIETDAFLGFYHENDITTLAITFLEEKGCELFGTSLNEIQKSGASFIQNCVHPTDLPYCVSLLTDFASQKNEQKLLTYIQRVKIGTSNNYVPFFTCVKLNLEKQVFCCVTLPLTGIEDFELEVTNLLEEADYINESIVLFNKFTKREKEVIVLVCKGFSAKEIGEQLFLSPFTIEKHKKNIYKKGGFNNNAELIKFALSLNLI